MRKSEVFVDPQDLSFYKIIFNEAPIGILFAQEHKIVYINPYFLKIFGYTKDDELIGKDIIIMYPPEIRQIQLQRAENRAERIEDSRSYEVDGIRKDGTRFPMNMTVSEVLIEKQSSLIAFISDLSEIKEVEKERNVTIAQYQTIFEKTPLGLVISRQGNILFCNKNFAQMFGYGVDDLVGSSVEIILDEQERSTIIERGIRREAGEEEPPSYNTIGLRKNGETFDIHIEVTPINLPEGVALLVFVQDVTTQKIAEVALIESEEHNRIMVENAPEAIIVMDVNTGLFIDANKNAEKLFNLPKSELITYGPLDLSPKYQPNGQVSSVYAETKIKEALTGLSTPFEWIYLDSAGQRIECEIRLASLPSTRNTLIIGSIIDISERKQSEIELQLTREQLFQAQKMETIGRITGGIAHDFNNMLTGIIGYTDILLSQVTETAYKDQIQDIKQIATKAATLTGELLSFSRKRVFKQQIVNLNTIAVI
ncbi:MAG: PAS domain S-box protein [Candidatus Heimdallarchaeota archaeon]|nr:PAS domain S-box protein [Candidatus Heimdallarchaeota archaeon]